MNSLNGRFHHILSRASGVASIWWSWWYDDMMILCGILTPMRPIDWARNSITRYNNSVETSVLSSSTPIHTSKLCILLLTCHVPGHYIIIKNRPSDYTGTTYSYRTWYHLTVPWKRFKNSRFKNLPGPGIEPGPSFSCDIRSLFLWCTFTFGFVQPQGIKSRAFHMLCLDHVFSLLWQKFKCANHYISWATDYDYWKDEPLDNTYIIDCRLVHNPLTVMGKHWTKHHHPTCRSGYVRYPERSRWRDIP